MIMLSISVIFKQKFSLPKREIANNLTRIFWSSILLYGQEMSFHTASEPK